MIGRPVDRALRPHLLPWIIFASWKDHLCAGGRAAALTSFPLQPASTTAFKYAFLCLWVPSISDSVGLVPLSAFKPFWAQIKEVNGIFNLIVALLKSSSFFAVPLQKIQMVNYAFIDYILISQWIAISIIFHNYYSLVHFPNLKIGLSAQLSQIYLKHLKKFTLIFSIFLWQLIIMRPQIIVVALEAYIFLLQFSPNDWRNTSWY